jgi:hypothetical protein
MEGGFCLKPSHAEKTKFMPLLIEPQIQFIFSKIIRVKGRNLNLGEYWVVKEPK